MAVCSKRLEMLPKFLYEFFPNHLQIIENKVGCKVGFSCVCPKTPSFKLQRWPSFIIQKYIKHIQILPSHVIHNRTDFHHVPAWLSSLQFQKTSEN